MATCALEKHSVVLDAAFTVGAVAAEEVLLCWVLGCGHAHPSPGKIALEALGQGAPVLSVLAVTVEGRGNNGSTALSEAPLQEHWIGNVSS